MKGAGLGAAFGGRHDQREVTNERTVSVASGAFVCDFPLIAQPGYAGLPTRASDSPMNFFMELHGASW